ncbi:MAG TPA: hypothetical protein DFR83_07795 [Deltaproteobacteria bacterium]|nr:hypothetical protein [Deltaproteobacteria bacterium]
MRRITCLFALITTACSDADGTKSNPPPTAEISSHATGDTVREGFSEPLLGLVNDSNHDIERLTVSWFVGDTAVCTESTPASDGVVTCDHMFSSSSGDVLLEVRDPEGGLGSAQVTLDVQPTDAPLAEITAPTESGIYYAQQPIDFQGTVSDTEDPAEDLTITWETDALGDLALPIDVTSEGAVEAIGELAEGEHTVRLRVVDSTGKEGVDSVVIEVGPVNSAPTCAITAPEDGSAGTKDALVVFTAEVDDIDVNPNTLSVEWMSDQDGALGTSTPDSTGGVTFTESDLTVNTHEVTMLVTDEIGATCTASIVYTVGTPPELTITAPLDRDVFNETELVDFTGTALDNEDLETDLELVWNSRIDGEFSTSGPNAEGDIAFSAELSPGAHTITVRATDTDGLYTETTFDITVNAVPTQPTVTIDPDPAYINNPLTASVTGSTDPDDSGTVTYRYDWYEDGVLSSVSTDAIFPSADTKKHSTYRVVVTPSDGTGEGPAGEAERTIDNTDPILSGPTLSASTVVVGDTLTCAASASDIDGDTTSITYSWSDGSTGTTYAVTSSDDPGDTISCTATASDGDGGVVTGTVTATVDNTVPVVDSIEIDPTSGKVGDTLICTLTASDADGETPTISYTWSTGGASATYTIAASDDPGDTINCIATATDADGGSVTASTSATVDNTPPVLTSVTVSPAAAMVGEDLTCSANASDADGEAPTLTYAWSTGETSDVYTVRPSDDPGDTISCTVTATDTDGGTDTGTASASVDNSDPVIDTISVSPSNGTVGDTLSCTATASDGDGESPTIAYTWSTGETGPSYTIQASDNPGDIISCTATATDLDLGTGSGTASATVDNSAPVIESIEVDPRTGKVGDMLTCTATASDDDGGTPTITYAWSTGATGDTYTIQSSDDPGDTITCTATATDTDGGLVSFSTGATVENSDPTIDSMSISPTTAHNDDTLTCSATTSDADGDTPIVAYTWSGSVSGSLGSSSTIDLSTTAAQSGETITCTVAATDPDGGAATGTATRDLDNRTPTISLSLSPSSGATRNDTITCTATVNDSDDDIPTTDFAWTVEGSSVWATSTSGLTSTLEGMFAAEDEVVCTATVDDGKGGTATASASTTITNTAPTVSAVTLDKSVLYTNNALTASVTTSDAEGDPLTTTYDWYVEGVSVQNGTNETLNGASASAGFDKGDEVYVVVSVTDGADTVTSISSTLEVLNSSPGAPVVTILPNDPVAGEDLTCKITTDGFDADGDTLTYTMSWSYDSTAYTGASTAVWTDDTVSGADTTIEEEWVCTATPNDGDESGTPGSDSVTIGCDPSTASGEGEDCPGTTCLTILNDGHSTGDGTYWIDPDGSGAFEAYCLMDSTYDGGGWTLLLHVSTSVDETDKGTSGDFSETEGTSLAYSRLTIYSDLMLDADSAVMTETGFTQRTLVSGVHSSLTGRTLYSLWSSGTQAYVEAEDNSNVTNYYGGSTSSTPYANYGVVTTGSSVLVFNDSDSSCGTATFLVGAAHSYSSGWTNCAGWPQEGGTVNWPAYYRIFAR